MQFFVEGTIQTGFDALDFAVSDILVLNDGGVATVFATSGENGGLASYTLSSGAVATFSDHVFYNPAWQAGVCDELSLIEDAAGTQHLIFGMTDSTSLGGYAVSASGDIGVLATFDGLDVATLCAKAVHVTGGDEILVAGTGTGFASYTLDGTGLQTQSVLADPATIFPGTISVFADVVVDGHAFTVAATDGENAVIAFENTAAGPAVTDVSGYAEGVGLMCPTAIEAAVVDGQTFVIVGSAMEANGALTVFHVDAAGALNPTDHVLDTLATRFGAVQDVTVTNVAGINFVLAGGGDDGLSLFILLPGGQLQHVDTLVDSLAAGLANVSALGATVLGDTLRVFASSQFEGMMTDISVGLQDLGVQLRAVPEGAALSGTDGDDVLVGGAGDDTLAGGAGDDILVDGAGFDDLTGGAGRDTFVFRADGVEDVIQDFDPALDRLDLSSWPMFRDRGGLVITETAFGATVTWRDETLALHGVAGALDTEAVRSSVIQAIDRPIDRSSAVLPEAGGTTIWAGDDDNVITGTAEMVSVHLQGGNDSFETVFGDAGTPGIFVDGGDGDDVITAAAGDDELVGGLGADVITGAGGDDILSGGAGDDEIFGDSGSDVIDGGDGDDVVSAGGDDDQITGGAGNDTLKGHRGDDTIHGGDGNDRILGGAGNDVMWGEAGKDQLIAGAGDDFLYGGLKHDKLKGEDGADHLEGGDGNDRLVGGTGNDVLIGEAGVDALYGGDGDDQLSGGDDPDALYGEGDADTLSGGLGEDRLFGGLGNDILNGDEGRDELRGEDGDDVLHGGPDNDKLFGEAGDDQLFGGDGTDMMNGGLGNDVMWGGAEKDRMLGYEGDDIAYGGDGNDKIKGNDGHDQLFGELGDDKLIGKAGNDALYGGDGNDMLAGGAGDDWMDGEDGMDLFYGNAGADTIYGGSGDDTIYGGLDDDNLNGGAGQDVLRGEDGDDFLSGGSDSDTLKGGDGNDILRGGRGNDTLLGGDGADVFEFNFTSDHDTINNFDPAFDLIRIEDATPGEVSLDTSGASLQLTWGAASVTLSGLIEGDFEIAWIDFV